MSSSDPFRSWTFVTSHTRVLLRLAREPRLSARELAAEVGITQRQAQRIVADLVADGYVKRTRVGRRNAYRVDLERGLRHPALAALTVGELVEALLRGL